MNIIPHGCLLTGLLLVAPLSASFAEDGYREWTDTKEVVVTAAKNEGGILDTPVSVEVVTEQQIHKLGAVTLRDIFEKTPGVFINPGLGEMSVRGAGAFGTLVLIDGRRIAGERSFKYELNRLGAGTIERIEIVKGPMSVLYGSEAIGGVINIITKRPTETTRGSVNVRGGSNFDGEGERYSVDGNIRGTINDLRYSGYFSVMKTRPYTETEVATPLVYNKPPDDKTLVSPSESKNGKAKSIKDSYVSNTTYQDDADIFNIGGTLEYSLTDGLEIGADFSYIDEKRDLVFIGAQYPSSYGFPVSNIPIAEDLDTHRYDAAGRLKWKATENLEFRWVSYGSWYTKGDVLSPVYYNDLGYTTKPDGGGTCHGKVTTISHEFIGDWSAGMGHNLLFGAEYRDATRESPWFTADRTNSKIGYITRSVYVQDKWALTDRLDLVPGLRYDSYSDFDDQTLGSIGAQYGFGPSARLRVHYGQGYRAPSGPELYMNRNTAKGHLLGARTLSILKTAVTDLQPETSNNFEIGIDGKGSGWKYDLSAYYNTMNDRIGQVSKGSYYTFENVGDARIRGIDAYLGYSLFANFDINTAITLMDAENRTTGLRLDYTPETILSIAADYRPLTNVLLSTSVFYTGDQTYEKNKQRMTADAYTFVNFKASWMPSAMPGGELYAGIDNLFDCSVDRELGSTVGTFGYMGLRYMF
jgi:outer membrane receptor for ferrienterochelin and colicins